MIRFYPEVHEILKNRGHCFSVRPIKITDIMLAMNARRRNACAFSNGIHVHD
jgi:hypothetical protein